MPRLTAAMLSLARYARLTSNLVEQRQLVVWAPTLLGAAVLATASREALPVVVPVLALAAVPIAAGIYLYRTDGQLPVFDLGMLTILMTALYSVIPPLGFWLAGLHWTALTYMPLFVWNPGPLEVGALACREVVYLYSFTAAYLVFRGRAPTRSGPMHALPPTAIAAILLSGAALMAYFALLQWHYDYSYEPSYRGLTQASAAGAAERIPYVVRQVSHNLFAILFIAKLCMLAVLTSKWRDWRWRAVLFLWLGVEGLTTVMRMGARTWLVMLIMAAVLLYHRLVKPLRFARAAVLVVLLLCGAMVYGLARDLGGGLAGLSRVSATTSSRWATMNEFQALFGIAYDLKARKAAGLVGPIPWQIYANDVILLIPSQMLPFSKADPCVGYPIVDGIGLGCVIGVISQAVIGLDWIELVFRGLALGVLVAIVHRWYVRRQEGYWATMLYLCLCLWCHYTFRSSTFFIVYYVLYRFVPFALGVRLLQLMLRRAVRTVYAPGVL